MTSKPSDKLINVYAVIAEGTDELGNNYICGVYSSLNKATDKMKSLRPIMGYEYYIDKAYLDPAYLECDLDEDLV